MPLVKPRGRRLCLISPKSWSLIVRRFALCVTRLWRALGSVIAWDLESSSLVDEAGLQILQPLSGERTNWGVTRLLMGGFLDE